MKDLLDLALILGDLRDDLPSAGTMRRTIEATFDRYGTHALPAPLPAPPEDWARPFEAEAQKLGLATTDIKDAHETVEDSRKAGPSYRSTAGSNPSSGRLRWEQDRISSRSGAGLSVTTYLTTGSGLKSVSRS